MPFLPPSHRPTPRAATKHAPKGADRQKRRALATNSTTWRAMRAAHLAREPLCRMCKREGKVTEGKVVDHIDGDSWNNAPPNLQTLCGPHHSAKTARQDGGFGNPTTLRDRSR